MPQSQSIKQPPQVSWHDKNFERYLIQYAQANQLATRGELWDEAVAAARRLDYTGERQAKPSMALTPTGASLVGRLLSRLGLSERPHLGELDSIRAFLNSAPQQAAEQSEINWGPLRGRFGTWVIAHLRPGGEQRGSRPTPPRLQHIPPWDFLAARKLLNGQLFPLGLKV